MLVKCMTPGCQSRKEMDTPKPYRCFPCKTRISQDRANEYYHEHKNDIHGKERTEEEDESGEG